MLHRIYAPYLKRFKTYQYSSLCHLKFIIWKLDWIFATIFGHGLKRCMVTPKILGFACFQISARHGDTTRMVRFIRLIMMMFFVDCESVNT